MAVDLRGKVTNQAGSPKVGLTVNLYEAATWEASGAATSSTTTDSDGIWERLAQDATKTWLIDVVDGTKHLLIDARNRLQLTKLDLITDINTDTINEHTAASGVTIDGLLIKDSGATFQDNTLKIENPAATFNYTIVGAAITAARQLNLPLITGTDTLASLGLAQTWTALQSFGTNLGGTLQTAAQPNITSVGTLASPVLTTPDINGGTADSLTSLSIRSTGAAYDMFLATAVVFGANRTLTITIPDAATALTLTGDFIRSGAHSLTLTTTGTTDITLPTTGTVAILASPTFTGTVTIPTPFTLGAVSVTATGTELNYVDGVTSAIQTQMDLKAPLASPTLTTPDINGGTADSLTSLSIRSTGAAYDLLFATAVVFSANRTLTWTIGDANRIITMAGNINVAADFITSGANSLTLTTTGATDVTLPTTGTLATLAGTEELDNKTLDTSVAKGTWTASGTWTLPAFTLGGDIDGNSKEIKKVKQMGRVAESAALAPSATANTWGTAEDISPTSGYYGLDLRGLNYTAGGTFGAETLTIRCQTTLSDASIAAHDITFVGTGTNWQDEEEFINDLARDNLAITKVTIKCKSTIADSTATGKVKIWSFNT